MPNNILFVFEGSKTEGSITDSLLKFFVNENTVVTCAYCNTVYGLHNAISSDEYLDTFNLLRDMEVNSAILHDFKRSDFAQIYMFFDYDGHASNAGDDKLSELLAFFSEETEQGKLYISYPMVEALRHIENFDTFGGLKVSCEGLSGYKKVVGERSLEKLKNLKLWDIVTWKTVIESHLNKMNMIVNDIFTFPEAIVDQVTIFNHQIIKYKNKDNTVAVLSGFPVFIHDYYGNEKTKEMVM